MKLGYERKLQSKRKLPAERTEPPVKRPKTCLECLLEPDEQETTNIELVSIDVTTIPNKETGVVNTTNTVVSEEKDTCDYVGDHGMVESSRNRPHHVTHDHSYNDGQFEMEETGCCVNEPCLKKMKEKDEEIVTLKNAVDDRTQKLKLCQNKVKDKDKKILSHTDLKTDKTVQLLTGIRTMSTFDVLFSMVKQNVKKVQYWAGPSKESPKVRNLKKTPEKFGPKRALS